MGARRVLFLDATGLGAWRWNGGCIEAEGSFSLTPEGLKAFRDYVDAHRGSLYYVLAEVAEEGFHPEDIPSVRGRDRIALIRRKLAQYHYGTPLTVALAQGYRREGRRDERMVFAALTRPEQFAPWLDVLHHAEAALAGVFSVPQAIAPLAARLGGMHPCFLLTTLSRGGMRQTFFDGGHLRFSRLTLPGAGGADEAARRCAAETAKVHQYLLGHRLLGDDMPLPVLVLAHPADASAFRTHCRDSHELRFEFPDLVATARQRGLKTPLHDSHAEALFAHLLLGQPPRAQFAHADSRRFFHLRRIRFALGGTGLALLAACLLVAGWKFFDSRRIEESTAQVRSENDINRRKYQAMLDALPPLPLPPDQLHAVVGRYEELLRTSPGPGPLVLHLSRGLDGSPAVEIDGLDWSVDAAKPHAVIEIGGRLRPETATDRRSQLDIVEGLAERLGSAPAIQAQVTSLPFDLASGKIAKSGGEAPKFTLRVTQAL